MLYLINHKRKYSFIVYVFNKPLSFCLCMSKPCWVFACVWLSLVKCNVLSQSHNKELIVVLWFDWLTLSLISYRFRIQKQRATKSESTVDQLNLANMEKDQRIAELQAIHDEHKALLNSTAREKASMSAENHGLKTWDLPPSGEALCDCVCLW